jgi:uncharacterized protein DUF6338
VVPTTLTALLIVLLAIVPGFIATTMWGRSRTWRGHASDFRTMLLSVAISGVIHVISAPLTILWIIPARGDLLKHSYRAAGWAALVVLVVPTVLGIAAARFTDWFQKPMLKATDIRSLGIFRRIWATIVRGGITPSIWDWVFEAEPPDERYLVVTFTDGTRIGGVFEAGSYALTSPETHGLFLTREWVLDANGNFVSEIPDSEGVMVEASEVRSLRILRGGEVESTAQEEQCPKSHENHESRSVKGLCRDAGRRLLHRLVLLLLRRLEASSR